jgi:hypothetical protein
LATGKTSDANVFAPPPSMHKSVKTAMNPGMTRLLSSPGSHQTWEGAKQLSSSKSSSSFRSGKAFWLNLMEDPTSPQNSEEQNAYTPIGRMIQKTWTSGSSLSDASAYEIDNVDHLWQNHLEDIKAELEKVNRELITCTLGNIIQTTGDCAGDEQDASVATVQQQRVPFETFPMLAVAPPSKAEKHRELSKGKSISHSPETHQSKTETLSPLSAITTLSSPVETHSSKKSTDYEGGRKPLSQVDWARKGLGFAKEELLSLVSPTPHPLNSVAPHTNKQKSDSTEWEEAKPKSQFELARQSLGFESEELPWLVSPAARSPGSVTPHTDNIPTGCTEQDERKSESQFEWARKSLNLSKKEESTVRPKATRSPRVSIESAAQDFCLGTPKNESTSEKPISQFEWARRSLNLAKDNHTKKTPQTAPPKIRSTSTPRTRCGDNTDGAQEGQGFKSLLNAWKTVENDKVPTPSFLSPAAAAKVASRRASTTVKLPPLVGSRPSIEAVQSTESREYEAAEQARLARMVESFPGYQLRQKPEQGVLAIGQKFANRYVDSDFYESAFAKNGESNRALVMLENNDSFQITLGGSKLKGTKNQNEELKIRNVELVHSNHVDLAFDTCECSGSVFSGNDDLISFFLPQMGMACTCGKRKPVGFVNPDDPTALENVLRPWQVTFLSSFGITRSEQLVKARHRSAPLLARGLKQWRRKQGMIEFKTSSCSMAIDVWAKTAKVYARSIRKQLEIGQDLLERRPDEVMKELAHFVGDLPAAPKRRDTFVLPDIEPESEMEI